MSEQTKKTYKERSQAGKEFYFFLLKLFLSAAIILGAGLGYLWFWLDRYEKQSQQGAISNYFELVGNHDWDTLYEMDTNNFVELNSKDAIATYLFGLYGGKNHWGFTTSYTWSSDTSDFFYVYYEKERIAQLEVTKPEDSEVWVVRTYNPTGTYYFEDLSPAGFSINHHEINDNFFPQSEPCPIGFQELEMEEGYYPSVKRYTISSFVEEPSITLNDPNNMVVFDSLRNTYYIGPNPTSEQEEEFRKEIEETSLDYAKYITKDGSFYALNQHLYPNTTFYNNIRGFDNQWFSDHSSISFDHFEIYDVMPMGENAFIGTASFDYTVQATAVSQTYSNTYQLFFIKNSQGNWKLLDLITLNEEETANH